MHLETEIYSEPEATVKWYKNGQECSADARLKITHDSKRYEEYSMTLNLCKVDDTGVYEVRAKNKVGESVSKCQVNILSKLYLISGKNVSGIHWLFSLAQPEIDHVDIFEQHSYESVPLKYEVIAHGIPKPEAIWYHDGKEIKPDANTAIIVDGVRWEKLRFQNLEIIVKFLFSRRNIAWRRNILSWRMQATTRLSLRTRLVRRLTKAYYLYRVRC